MWTKEELPCSRKIELIGYEVEIFLFMKCMLKKTKDLSMNVKWEHVDCYEQDRMLHNSSINMYYTYCKALVSKLIETSNDVSENMKCRRNTLYKSLMANIELTRSLCYFSNEYINTFFLPCKLDVVQTITFVDDIYKPFLDFHGDDGLIC